jgi:hypothetical protein
MKDEVDEVVVKALGVSQSVSISKISIELTLIYRAILHLKIIASVHR